MGPKKYVERVVSESEEVLDLKRKVKELTEVISSLVESNRALAEAYLGVSAAVLSHKQAILDLYGQPEHGEYCEDCADEAGQDAESLDEDPAERNRKMN